MNEAKYSVLFVCFGNVCRSPIGEAVFDDLAKKAGVRDQWLVGSAGTSYEEVGNQITPIARKILLRHSIINFHHSARQIVESDFIQYGLILGFDDVNVEHLHHLKPPESEAEIQLVNYFNPNKRPNTSIEDPQSLLECEAVYQDCYDSCKAILEKYTNK